MGNFFSANHHKFTELQHRLQTLEDLDRNRDGVISKEEFEDWKTRQKADLDLFRETIVKMKDKEYQEKLLEFQKQVETLEEINQSLEKRLLDAQNHAEGLINNQSCKTDVFNQLSKRKIQEAVDRMINNDSVNIKYLPDFVERQLYKNMFNILLGLLNELVEGSSIEILGHEITLALNAKFEKNLPTDPEKLNNLQLSKEP